MNAKTAAALVLVSIALGSRVAGAHQVGLSRGDYALRGAVIDAELVFQKGELAQLVPAADTNRDGALDATEIAAARRAVEAAVVGGVEVTGDGAPCAGALVDAAAVDADGVSLRATYTCAVRPRAIRVRVKLFAELAHGHRHLAALRAGGSVVDAVASAAQPSFALTVDAEPGQVPAATSAGAMFRLGVEHILTGYDHLLFLFGLVLVGGRARSLVGVVTAFTAAHSISLALAALGVWAPSSRFVEPAIALSIAYVGVENLFVKSAEKRWRITFPFGLVHGFGFAGALAEIELPRAKVPLALLTFNLGVEAGQLAAMAVVLPVVVFASRWRWFRLSGVRALSVLLAITGLAWFAVRVRG